MCIYRTIEIFVMCVFIFDFLDVIFACTLGRNAKLMACSRNAKVCVHVPVFA